jgi:hypothetical protein
MQRSQWEWEDTNQLTGSSGLGDDSLAGIAVNKDGRSLDVVQLFAQERIRSLLLSSLLALCQALILSDSHLADIYNPQSNIWHGKQAAVLTWVAHTVCGVSERSGRNTAVGGEWRWEQCGEDI